MDFGIPPTPPPLPRGSASIMKRSLNADEDSSDKEPTPLATALAFFSEASSKKQKVDSSEGSECIDLEPAAAALVETSDAIGPVFGATTSFVHEANALSLSPSVLMESAEDERGTDSTEQNAAACEDLPFLAANLIQEPSATANTVATMFSFANGSAVTVSTSALDSVRSWFAKEEASDAPAQSLQLSSFVFSPAIPFLVQNEHQLACFEDSSSYSMETEPSSEGASTSTNDRFLNEDHSEGNDAQQSSATLVEDISTNQSLETILTLDLRHYAACEDNDANASFLNEDQSEAADAHLSQNESFATCPKVYLCDDAASHGARTNARFFNENQSEASDAHPSAFDQGSDLHTDDEPPVDYESSVGLSTNKSLGTSSDMDSRHDVRLQAFEQGSNVHIGDTPTAVSGPSKGLSRSESLDSSPQMDLYQDSIGANASFLNEDTSPVMDLFQDAAIEDTGTNASFLNEDQSEGADAYLSLSESLETSPKVDFGQDAASEDAGESASFLKEDQEQAADSHLSPSESLETSSKVNFGQDASGEDVGAKASFLNEDQSEAADAHILPSESFDTSSKVDKCEDEASEDAGLNEAADAHLSLSESLETSSKVDKCEDEASEYVGLNEDQIEAADAHLSTSESLVACPKVNFGQDAYYTGEDVGAKASFLSEDQSEAADAHLSPSESLETSSKIDKCEDKDEATEDAGLNENQSEAADAHLSPSERLKTSSKIDKCEDETSENAVLKEDQSEAANAHLSLCDCLEDSPKVAMCQDVTREDAEANESFLKEFQSTATYAQLWTSESLETGPKVDKCEIEASEVAGANARFLDGDQSEDAGAHQSSAYLGSNMRTDDETPFDSELSRKLSKSDSLKASPNKGFSHDGATNLHLQAAEKESNERTDYEPPSDFEASEGFSTSKSFETCSKVDLHLDATIEDSEASARFLNAEQGKSANAHLLAAGQGIAMHTDNESPFDYESSESLSTSEKLEAVPKVDFYQDASGEEVEGNVRFLNEDRSEPTSLNISPEQRIRMEQNRQQALVKKQQSLASSIGDIKETLNFYDDAQYYANSEDGLDGTTATSVEVDGSGHAPTLSNTPAQASTAYPHSQSFSSLVSKKFKAPFGKDIMMGHNNADASFMELTLTLPVLAMQTATSHSPGPSFATPNPLIGVPFKVPVSQCKGVTLGNSNADASCLVLAPALPAFAMQSAATHFPEASLVTPKPPFGLPFKAPASYGKDIMLNRNHADASFLPTASELPVFAMQTTTDHFPEAFSVTPNPSVGVPSPTWTETLQHDYKTADADEMNEFNGSEANSNQDHFQFSRLSLPSVGTGPDFWQHRQALEHQSRNLHGKFDLKLARERVRVADAIMHRAEDAIKTERLAMMRDFQKEKDDLLREASKGYEEQWSEMQKTVIAKRETEISTKVSELRDDWKRRNRTTAHLQEEYAGNVEAQALLVALKEQWSSQCDLHLEAREKETNTTFKDELNIYRAEIRKEIEAERDEYAERAVTAARVEWDREHLVLKEHHESELRRLKKSSVPY